MVLFSYGSGLASSMYSLKVTSNLEELSRLMAPVADVPQRLSCREIVEPAKFEAIMKLREDTHHLAPYTPVGDNSQLFPGTYYLASVDDKYRRVYKRVAPSNGGAVESGLKSTIAQIISS